MEDKILLMKKADKGLYLFEHDNRVEFVIGYLNGDPHIGEHVDGWTSGTYYRSLDAAYQDLLEYASKVEM